MKAGALKTLSIAKVVIRKRPGAMKPKKLARSAVVKPPELAPARWEPARAWLSEQRKIRSTLANLMRMQIPVVVGTSPLDDTKMFFARGCDGKELFILDEPKFHHPGERALRILSRKDALALSCLWAVPSCLREHLVEVLKKARAW